MRSARPAIRAANQPVRERSQLRGAHVGTVVNRSAWERFQTVIVPDPAHVSRRSRVVARSGSNASGSNCLPNQRVSAP